MFIEKKYLLTLDLQTFSDDEIEVELEEDGIDILTPDQEEDQENDQEEIELEEEEQKEEVEDEEEEEQPRANETGKAVIAERRKWQEKMKVLEKQAKVAERLMNQAGVNDADEFIQRLDFLESQRLQEHGVPAELADRMAKAEREIKEQQSDIRRQRLDVEAEKLKSDPFYADIDEHMDELADFALQTGVSLEDAYLVKHGKRRMKERETEIEAKVKSNRAKRDAKKVDVSPSGSSSTKKRVSLTAEQRAVAKAAGMTPEEYAKYL